MGKWLAKDATLHYGAIIRLHMTYYYYCCFMEGYSIYIGTASTLYLRFFFFFFILRRMGKNKYLAHHTRMYVHTRRVSI